MLKAVIFDLDGTLTKFNLDIKAVKERIGGGRSEKNILDFIEGLGEEERADAKALLEAYECEAAMSTELNEGVENLFTFLRAGGTKTALVTRNNRRAVEIACSKFGLSFHAIVSREDARPKPARDQLDLALERLGVGREEAIFVGDHLFDLQAGKSAGIRTGLLRNAHANGILKEADFVLDSMDQLIEMIR